MLSHLFQIRSKLIKWALELKNRHSEVVAYH